MKTLYIDGTAPLKPQGLQDLSKLIQKSTRIIVLTGAGISTSSGIPVSLSLQTPFSSNIFTQDFKGNPAARDLLDAVNLGRGRNDGWIKTLQWCSNTRQQATQAKPSKTHRYIGALAEQQKLLRYYTQNVDGIESREKILPPELIVLLHGSLESLRCLKCCSESAWSHTFDDNIWKKEPQPTFCITGCVTTNVKRGGALGVLSPNILLYNEDNPREKEITDQINADTIWRADLPDLFIVIGTSLRIRDPCKATKAFSDAVHKAGGKVIFVNKTAPSTQWKAVFDYFVKGDCDSWAEIMTDSRCLGIVYHGCRELLLTQTQNPPHTPRSLRCPSQQDHHRTHDRHKLAIPKVVTFMTSPPLTDSWPRKASLSRTPTTKVCFKASRSLPMILTRSGQTRSRRGMLARTPRPSNHYFQKIKKNTCMERGIQRC